MQECIVLVFTIHFPLELQEADMPWNSSFFITSVLLGVALAMDAFSVSLANGLKEPRMKHGKMLRIAGTFAVFQAIMPMIGWLCVHTAAQRFRVFSKAIPYIALIVLAIIGGYMIWEGCQKAKAKDTDETEETKTGWKALMAQGVATSIDALSVGFTIAEYGYLQAIVCAGIIAFVTLIICLVGLVIGRKIGSAIGAIGEVVGGIILICIGLKIFFGAF